MHRFPAGSFLSRLLSAASCRPSGRLCATGRPVGSRTTTPPSAEKRIPRAASTSRFRGVRWGRPAHRCGSCDDTLALTPQTSSVSPRVLINQARGAQRAPAVLEFSHQVCNMSCQVRSPQDGRDDENISGCFKPACCVLSSIHD